MRNVSKTKDLNNGQIGKCFLTFLTFEMFSNILAYDALEKHFLNQLSNLTDKRWSFKASESVKLDNGTIVSRLQCSGDFNLCDLIYADQVDCVLTKSVNQSIIYRCFKLNPLDTKSNEFNIEYQLKCNENSNNSIKEIRRNKCYVQVNLKNAKVDTHTEDSLLTLKKNETILNANKTLTIKGHSYMNQTRTLSRNNQTNVRKKIIEHKDDHFVSILLIFSLAIFVLFAMIVLFATSGFCYLCIEGSID